MKQNKPFLPEVVYAGVLSQLLKLTNNKMHHIFLPIYLPDIIPGAGTIEMAKAWATTV
jgi:hypothetical protein